MPKLIKVPNAPADVGQEPKHGRLYLRMYSASTGEIYRSLGEKEWNRRAKDLAERIRQEFYRNGPDYRPQRYAEVAEEAFRVCMEGNRQSTVSEARRIYDSLICAFGRLPIESVTDDLWLEQLKVWRAETKRRSYSQVRVYAVQIDRFAFRRGYKRVQCSFPVSDPKRREGTVLTEAEFQRLLATASGFHRARTRDYLRCVLLCGRYMGMRRGEILGLTKDRVDLQRGSIRLDAEHTKTGSRKGHGRTFAIAPEAKAALAHVISRYNGPYVFPNARGTQRIGTLKTALRELVSRSGVAFKLHDLRHTFLTQKLLVEKKAPLDVAIYAGVSLEVIQSVYLHPKVEDTAHVVQTISESGRRHG